MEIDNFSKEPKKSKLRWYVSGVLIVALIILIELFTTFIGPVVENFFPCEDPTGNSAPCYLKYDIIGFNILFSLLVLLIIKTIIDVIKSKKTTKSF